VTVDFPHEVEVPPQSCTAGQVAHISYHCKGCELCLTPLLIVLHNLLMCIKWKCFIIFFFKGIMLVIHMAKHIMDS